MTATRLTYELVVVGVDGSAGSVGACRQAARPLEPTGRLELVAVYDGATAERTGWNAGKVRAALEGEVENAVSSAHSALGDAGRPVVIDGEPARALLREVTQRDDMLAVARELLRRAPCSVLVAQPTQGDGTLPRAIAVGVGGSREEAGALDVARQLEQRFEAPLRTTEPTGALLDATQRDTGWGQARCMNHPPSPPSR